MRSPLIWKLDVAQGPGVLTSAGEGAFLFTFSLVTVHTNPYTSLFPMVHPYV